MLSFVGYLQDIKNKNKPERPKKTVNQILDNYCDETQTISILDQILNYEDSTDIIESNVYRDLEFFEGLEDKNNNIFNIINKTETIFGKLYLAHILKSPTQDIDLLKKRQDIFHKINNSGNLDSLTTKLGKIKELEKDIIWILKEKNNEEKQLINSVYFTNNFLQILNYNEDVLTFYSLFKIVFAPVYGVLSPLILFLLPYLYIHFFTKIKFDFNLYIRLFKMSIFGGFNMLGGNSAGNSKINMTKYFSLALSFIIYIQNFMNTIEISKNTNKIINVLHEKINKLNEFMNMGYEIIKDTKELLKREDIAIFSNLIQNDIFTHPPSLFSNKGKILTTFRTIDNIENFKNKYKEYFNCIGEIDMYSSILKFINNLNSRNLNICYTKYLTNSSPTLNITNIWHPSLIDKQIVSNTIKIGNKNPNNIILTGPNAGGKSTFIKGISISLLLSQTLGISFASEFELTPFSLVNTYLNIPDCKGKESLFEAEMHRAKKHIDKLDSLEKDKFSFIVMDEIFSSTNPEEGISGAYAIANKLASNNNSIALITTHFSYLTKLSETMKFKNYNIPIERDEDKNIKYTYTLKEGSSSQFIALELLKHKGFDNEIVESAQEICQKIVDEKKKEKDEAVADDKKEEKEAKDEPVADDDKKEEKEEKEEKEAKDEPVADDDKKEEKEEKDKQVNDDDKKEGKEEKDELVADDKKEGKEEKEALVVDDDKKEETNKD